MRPAKQETTGRRNVELEREGVHGKRVQEQLKGGEEKETSFSRDSKPDFDKDDENDAALEVFDKEGWKRNAGLW